MRIMHNDVRYRENIETYLIQRAHAVRVDTNGNLLNLAVLSEDFYAEFLNTLLDLHLKNANASERNTKGIDLIDLENHVVVQVSATCAPNSIRAKIRNSIMKFNQQGFGTWQFYFVPITDKAPELRSDFALPDGVRFDQSQDILDIARIMDLAKGIEKLRALSRLVDQYSRDETDKHLDFAEDAQERSVLKGQSDLRDMDDEKNGEYILISYSYEQKEPAKRIRDILELNGIVCKMAADEAADTSTIASNSMNVISACAGFVAALSVKAQDSACNMSELKAAVAYKKRIYPFFLEKFSLSSELETYLGNLQVYDAYNSWDASIERMVRSIRWNLKSIDIFPSPDTILRDPVKIKASLPHILEEGYVLFGRYNVQKLLGIYATSQQHYIAEDTHTHMQVLVNYIDRTVPYKELFFGISTAGAFFQHPYISSPIDEYSNESYFVHVEPFYTVKSLYEVISEGGPQSLQQVKKWAIGICEAMLYLNREKGYIYGQMTPINIRLRENGLPLLFDVSIALPIGSRYYDSFDRRTTPPEAFLSCSAVPAIDVYALGVNMYYALTGTFISPNQKPDYTPIPSNCRKIIQKCLKCEADHRYQDFSAILSDLEKIRCKPIDRANEE